MHATTGGRWVTLDQGGTAAVWDRDGARILCKPESTRGLASCNDTRFVAISADGSRVATYDNDNLHLWDPATGLATDVDSTSVTALALSPDGASLATAAAANNRLLLITREGARTVGLSDSQPASITTVAFTPDGRAIAAGINSEVVLFDRESGARRDFVGHEGEIAAIAFTDDGRMITTSTDLTARVWNLADGSSRVLRGHTRRITTIEVHGDVAVTTSLDGTARLWDLRSETSRILLGHDAPSIVAGVAATGEIVTVDRDGRLARYRDDVPYGEAALRVWIAVLTSSGSSAITQ
jgi:WD40 repeat protein